MKICKSCHSTNVATIPYVNKNVPEDVIIWSKFNTDYCVDCGLGTISPEIPREELIRFYQESAEQDIRAYNPKIFTRNLNPGYVVQAALVALHGDFYDKTEIRMLDIGCGAFGYSFNAFRAVFKNKTIKFYGIDANPIIPKLLENNQINYLGEAYNVLGSHPHAFDIITMSHYLEHLMFEDVRHCLSTVKSALKPDGIIFIEVPHDDLRIFERQAVPSAPHTNFFTPPSLQKTVEEAGLKIIHTQTAGPGWKVLWDGYSRHSATGSMLQRVMRGVKKAVPIHIKERIKNIVHTTSAEELASHMAIINSKGAFLQIIAQA